MKDLEKKCDRPDNWDKGATVEKCHLVIRIQEFLRKALRYSEEYPALERTVINKNIASVVYGILPETLSKKLAYKTINLECGTKNTWRR